MYGVNPTNTCSAGEEVRNNKHGIDLKMLNWIMHYSLKNL